MDDLSGTIAFLRAQRTMTLATVGHDGRPQAATVEYAVTDDLTLIFDTFSTSRKYLNLQRDRRVACVITAGNRTVQCEGLATELAGEDLGRMKPLFFAAVPRGAKFDDRPETCYFLVRLGWLRDSDYGQDPWRQREWSF
jgi:pyridoxine/pyridoxamine 5'-phosphate oxidase